MVKAKSDPGLNTLLDMDGYILDQEGGYWVKIEARQICQTEGVPHGISYSLTLHDRYGKRIMGYDNSHAVKKPKKFKYAGQRLPLTTSIGMHRTRASRMGSKTLSSC